MPCTGAQIKRVPGLDNPLQKKQSLYSCLSLSLFPLSSFLFPLPSSMSFSLPLSPSLSPSLSRSLSLFLALIHFCERIDSQPEIHPVLPAWFTLIQDLNLSLRRTDSEERLSFAMRGPVHLPNCFCKMTSYPGKLIQGHPACFMLFPS